MTKKKNKLNIISTIVLIIFLLVGLSVMLYPTVSDWWNSRVQSYAIAGYDSAIENLDDDEKDKMIKEAEEYNIRLSKLSSPFDDFDEITGYEDILDISDTGIMGYITIPTINVELPIYHGTSEEVLNIAVGHMQGSSLPIGGESTHAVISAHRGLPSARLFTDLDKLAEGDTFTITILDKVLTYEVEKINIILPDEMEYLAIVPGEDLVTLMTCTPYGVNTHRLLVRAHRIDTTAEKTVNIAADAVQIDSMTVIPFIGLIPVLVMFLIWMFGGRKGKSKEINDILEKHKFDID